MRVQEIWGKKDVHNMKARSLWPCCLIKRGPNSGGQANPGFEGGQGVQGVQGCLGVQGAFRGVR